MVLKIGEVIAAGTRSTVHICGPDLVAKVPLSTTPDSWIKHEALYTAAVRAAGAPAPEMVDVVEIDGRLVGVYRRIHGPSMWDAIRTAPETAEQLGRVLGRLHADILGLVAPLTVPRQRDRLAGKIRRAASSTDMSVLAAVELIPHDSPENQLCHGDLHPGNVIMSPTGPMVVDWFDACRGAAVGDIARSSLLMGSGGDTLGSIPHLSGASADTIETLHHSYLDAVRNDVTVTGGDFRLWRRIEAAARLAEGLATTELLAVWRSA